MIPYSYRERIHQIELRTNQFVTLLCYSLPSLSLAPGFSPVSGESENFNRFSGFPPAQKPLKRLEHSRAIHTGLKPGAKETQSVQP